MQAGLKADTVTYSALVSACEKVFIHLALSLALSLSLSRSVFFLAPSLFLSVFLAPSLLLSHFHSLTLSRFLARALAVWSTNSASPVLLFLLLLYYSRA